jgi:hypothetical protein
MCGQPRRESMKKLFGSSSQGACEARQITQSNSIIEDPKETHELIRGRNCGALSRISTKFLREHSSVA